MKLAALKRFRYHALILVGALIAYVAADVWWHTPKSQSLKESLGLIPIDPFSPAALQHNESATTRYAGELCRRIFPNWKLHYTRATSPFRPRDDPNGASYFPTNFDGGYSNQFTTFSLSGCLRALREPSLFQAAKQSECELVFRLTVISSWGPYFTCRYQRNRDSSTIARGASVDPVSGKIIHERSFNISDQDAIEIESIIQNPGFWEEWNSDENGLYAAGLDGALWVFEARIDGRYEFLKAWSPDFLVVNYQDSSVPMGGTLRNNVRDLSPYIRLGAIVSHYRPSPPSVTTPWLKVEEPDRLIENLTVDFLAAPKP